MITFKDYLTELFDKPVPFEGEYGDYYFELNGVKYNVRIEYYYSSVHKIEYEISFYALIKNHNEQKWIHSFEDSLKGNATKVMSTVVAICKKYFSYYQLESGDGIVYSVETPSKEKLYKAMLTKFLNDSNIKFKYTKTPESAVGDGHSFTIL